ncbi:hypothetical protein B0T17DRAFT_528168 [Bombardia bombarda]|uniref:DNAJC9 HTH domain-containing protein n=1 Tax=Bombardia bombarda TaxID=252184 RepID=A0AA39XBE5_9PEZI|nr:hypothetical protein B0T17DRAFT_528168 [Bombardia bombarda]
MNQHTPFDIGTGLVPVPLHLFCRSDPNLVHIREWAVTNKTRSDQAFRTNKTCRIDQDGRTVMNRNGMDKRKATVRGSRAQIKPSTSGVSGMGRGRSGMATTGRQLAGSSGDDAMVLSSDDEPQPKKVKVKTENGENIEFAALDEESSDELPPIGLDFRSPEKIAIQEAAAHAIAVKDAADAAEAASRAGRVTYDNLEDDDWDYYGEVIMDSDDDMAALSPIKPDPDTQPTPSALSVTPPARPAPAPAPAPARRERTPEYEGEYKGSTAERHHLIRLYQDFKGDMRKVRNRLPAGRDTNGLTDRQESDRLLEILGKAVDNGVPLRLVFSHQQRWDKMKRGGKQKPRDRYRGQNGRSGSAASGAAA